MEGELVVTELVLVDGGHPPFPVGEIFLNRTGFFSKILAK